MITLNIDVTKIDKARLFKGKQGTYLDCVLIATPDSQYGHDYMIVQSTTKAEREAGQRGAILGNAKIFQESRPSEKSEPVDKTPAADSSDLPF